MILLVNQTATLKLESAQNKYQQHKSMTTSLVQNTSVPLNIHTHVCNQLLSQCDDEATSKRLRMLQNATTQISCILNDHTDYLLCKANKFKRQYSTFELKPAIEQVITIYKLQAQNARLRFTVKYDHDLPRQIETDRSRFQQVIRNIVSNALNYTTKGHIEVAFRYNEYTNWIEGIVLDTGRGISPENQR